jgi:hypothetical protein
MRVRPGVATFVLFLVAVAGCGGSDSSDTPNANGTPTGGATTGTTAPTPDASSASKPPITDVRVVVEVKGDVCQPPGVAGNCWLPFYPQPAIQGLALNQSAVCSNASRDQSSCWPQPGTEVRVVCTVMGGDGRLWYGVRVPPNQVKSGPPQDATPIRGSPDLLGHAAATYLRVLEPEALKSLPDCSTLK